MFITLGMLLLYPLLLILIRRLRLPSWTQVRHGNRPLHSSQQQVQKREHLTWIFSIMCFASLIAAIVGTINIAKTRQRDAYGVYSPQAWSGSYVVLNNTSKNWLYSSAGVNQGNLRATNERTGWGMEIYNLRDVNLQTINYPSFFPMKFNVSCMPTIDNPMASDCASGEFVEQPTPSYEGYSELDPQDHQKPEFTGFLNLTMITLSRHEMNVTSNSSIWTSAESYQGIGGVYAPLGEWHIYNSTLLQVGWSTGSKGPCQGLQINLSEEYEEIAWIVVGIIWQWWAYWAEHWGGCNWDITD